MKKMSWLIILLVSASFVLGGCEGCSKKDKAPAEEVTIEETVEEVVPSGSGAPAAKISEALSAALCKRMVECAPGTMTEEECVSQTTTSLNEAQKETPINVSEDKLKACVDSIGKGTCEEVLGTEPPKDCEFLK